MIVECNEVVEYDSAKEDEGVRLMQRRGPQNDLIDFEIPGGLPVQGDVHVRFFVFEVCLVSREFQMFQIFDREVGFVAMCDSRPAPP